MLCVLQQRALGAVSLGQGSLVICVDLNSNQRLPEGDELGRSRAALQWNTGRMLENPAREGHVQCFPIITGHIGS